MTAKRCWQWACERALDTPAAVARRIATGERVVPPEQPVSIDEELKLLERLSWLDLREFVAEFFTLDRFFLLYEARTRFFDDSRVKRLVRTYLA